MVLSESAPAFVRLWCYLHWLELLACGLNPGESPVAPQQPLRTWTCNVWTWGRQWLSPALCSHTWNSQGVRNKLWLIYKCSSFRKKKWWDYKHPQVAKCQEGPSQPGLLGEPGPAELCAVVCWGELGAGSAGKEETGRCGEKWPALWCKTRSHRCWSWMTLRLLRAAGSCLLSRQAIGGPWKGRDLGAGSPLGCFLASDIPSIPWG